MPVLHNPVVTLEDARVRTLSLSSLDLEVMIRVENPPPIGITLRELTFTVRCSSGNHDHEIAAGNTGRIQISARGSTVLRIPITSRNAALIRALATVVTQGSMQVTIQGTAIIDCLLFGWSIPFSKTLPVTMAQVADAVAGKETGKLAERCFAFPVHRRGGYFSCTQSGGWGTPSHAEGRAPTPLPARAG